MKMLCGFVFVLLLVPIGYTHPFRICPQGQMVAHDGGCIEQFHLTFTPNKTGRKLFDTPSGCPIGQLLTHDGACQDPFKLNVTGLDVPNVTATTMSSVNSQNSGKGSHEHKHTVTTKLGHRIVIKSSSSVSVVRS